VLSDSLIGISRWSRGFPTKRQPLRDLCSCVCLLARSGSVSNAGDLMFGSLSVSLLRVVRSTD
jgi:hypothetical protein